MLRTNDGKFIRPHYGYSPKLHTTETPLPCQVETQETVDLVVHPATSTMIGHNPCPIALKTHTVPYKTTGRTSVRSVVSPCLHAATDRIGVNDTETPLDAFSPAHARAYVLTCLRGAGRQTAKDGPERGRKTSSESHVRVTVQGTTTVDVNAVDDVVQSAYLRWLTSRQNNRTPLDTRAAAKYAVRDYWRTLRAMSPLPETEGSTHATSEPSGYLIVDAKEHVNSRSRRLQGDDTTTGKALRETVRMLSQGATRTEIAASLGVSVAYVSGKLLPRLKAIYS